MNDKITNILVLLILLSAPPLLLAQDNDSGIIQLGTHRIVSLDLGRNVSINVPDTCIVSKDWYETSSGKVADYWGYEGDKFYLSVFDKSGDSYDSVYASTWGDTFDKYISDSEDVEERDNLLTALEDFKQLNDYELFRRVYDRSIQYDDPTVRQLRIIMLRYLTNPENRDSLGYGEWHHSDGMIVVWEARSYKDDDRGRAIKYYGLEDHNVIFSGLLLHRYGKSEASDRDVIRYVFNTHEDEGVKEEGCPVRKPSSAQDE